MADDARQLQEEEPPPVPFDLGMQQPVASDSDGEFPEEAASPGMRKAGSASGARRGDPRVATVGLRRLDGPVAHARAGRGPVPAVDDDPSTPSRENFSRTRRTTSWSFRAGRAWTRRRWRGASRRTSRRSARRRRRSSPAAAPDAEAAPYASALAETLCKWSARQGAYEPRGHRGPRPERRRLPGSSSTRPTASRGRGLPARIHHAARDADAAAGERHELGVVGGVRNCGAFGHRDRLAADESRPPARHAAGKCPVINTQFWVEQTRMADRRRAVAWSSVRAGSGVEPTKSATTASRELLLRRPRPVWSLD